MKKTMRKSALLSSIAMLIVSAIVLTSATYAWFSSSKIVYVEELTAEVKVSTGLLISVDKGNEWSTKVDFADAVAVKDGWGAGYANGIVFDPVSSADANTWISAIYDEDTAALTTTPIVPGEKFVAAPLWVTGPVGETVKATIDFTGTDAQAAKCVKFALVPASGADGSTIGEYTTAVPAEANAENQFMGVSAAGTNTATEGAYITDGGKNITEIAAEGGITFDIPEGTTTDTPIMYVAFLWLEGNDADCSMLEFDVGGEDISFSMNLALVE